VKSLISSRALQTRTLLEPVLARLQREVDSLTEVLHRDALKLSEADSPDDLTSGLTGGLSDPFWIMSVKQTPRIAALTPTRAKNRKRIQNLSGQLSKQLLALKPSIEAGEPGSSDDTEQTSLVLDQLNRYRIALQSVLTRLQPMQYGSAKATALFQVVQLLRAARSDLERISSMPLSDFKATDEDNDGASGATASTPANMASSLRYFANPGPDFESASGVDCRAWNKKAKAIAFYLPQFYAFEENDLWWGKGFTEWRNVSRGAPRFAGHYQPRIPRDLGFYTLNDAEVLRQQCELARINGVEAFCFYYYWFDGKRLMDKPLDMFIEQAMPQDFCIMWANENWTRTWDGFDSEVLIEQSYRQADEEAFIADTARYMANPRYLRVNERPLFILYRPGLLPNAKETLARWRSKWAELLGIEPWILMVQGFDDMDPREYALDGAVEFPPHKVSVDTTDINSELTIFDPEFAGHVRRYEDVIRNSLSEDCPPFPLIKTVSPHWDNDARREGRGLTLHGSTPDLYRQWLEGAIDHAVANPFAGESLVFINAWNEWAEGAYLEPDVHYGHAYLNATQSALHGLAQAKERFSVLLAGKKAEQSGSAQHLLELATVLKQQFGLHVVIFLETGGELLPDYQALTHTVVLDEIGPACTSSLLAHHELDGALLMCASDGLSPILKENGVPELILSGVEPAPNQAFDEYAFGLLQHLNPELKQISVVVPNYNYAQYMDSRLNSIFEQRYPVFEIILLDDCSTDHSLATINSIVALSGRMIRIEPNTQNSGNVFRQWRKGLELIRGEHCWIAEADDLCAPSFLTQSASAFTKNTAMSFCDSVQIDTDGSVLANSYDYYLRRIDQHLFAADFSMNGDDFARKALSVMNVILNESYSLVGDWRLYLDVLAAPEAEIAWCAESLNTHRRHSQSVTHALDPQKHLDEVKAMHEHAKSLFGQADGMAEQVDSYQEELSEQFGLKQAAKLKAA